MAAHPLRSESGLTFPPCRRIKQRTGFEQVFRKRHSTNHWFVLYATENQSGISRLGVAASKKMLPKASARNFAKRMVREAFRRHVPYHCGLDVVITARRTIDAETAAASRLALTQQLQALQARCDARSSA